MKKIVHIMPHSSVLYNGTIIEMINTNINDFKIEEHLFIVSNEKVYNAYKNYENVILETNICKNMKLFKKYTENCDCIFLHSNTLNAHQLLTLNKKILKKIIWCEWGHDLYKNKKNDYKIKEFVKSIIKFIPNIIRTHRIKKIYAVGIGFQYDAIEVKQIYGRNMKIVMTPYGYRRDNKKQVDKIIQETNKDNKIIRIMIGHSAYKFLNHFKILQMLQKYKYNNIKISLVLAYGDKEYKRKVIEYAIELFGKDKVEIIDKMMNQTEYIKYLNTVDICILDYKHQAALGNIYYLLYMGKKLYLNKDGIIKLFTTLEGIETYNVSAIEKMSFEEFSKPIDDVKYGIEFAEFHIDEKNYIKLWKRTINEMLT